MMNQNANQIQGKAVILLEGKVQVFIVCGVCGSGKSTVADRVSQHFGACFIEGDDLHPLENKEMMNKGIPLDDEHRMPWLKRIAESIKLKSSEYLIGSKQSNNKIFVTCSALKHAYREQIESNLTKHETLIWVYLKINDQELLKQRMRTRKGHFMNENLIQSQFDTLEPPNSTQENVIELSVEMKSLEEIVDELINIIQSSS